MKKLLIFFTFIGIVSTLVIISISDSYAANITIDNSTSEGGIINNISNNEDKLNLNQGTSSGPNNTNFQINSV